MAFLLKIKTNLNILVHYKTCWKTKLIMSFCAILKIWDFGGDGHFSAIMEVFMGNWGAGIFQNDIVNIALHISLKNFEQQCNGINIHVS